MYNIGIVFLMGIAGIWKAIPLGYILGVDPLMIGLMTILGALLGIFIIFFLGGKVKKYVLERMENKNMKKRSGKALNLFEKYGTAGLGLMGTFLIGPNMTMAIGLVFVKSDRLLLMWTSLGIVLWSIILTVVAYYSIDLFNQLNIF